ncbi:MAG: hypothetical protein ACRENF_05485, partial [Thermodesulfobacteriota bacterium]
PVETPEEISTPEEVETPVEEIDEVPVETKDDEPEDEDKESLTSSYPRPSLKDVTKQYPDFFKKFPDLRHAFFREKEFTELYPTVDDAREASEKSETYDALVGALEEGNLAPVFEGLEDPEKVVTSFLPSLYKHNQELYYQVTTPLLEKIIKQAYREGVANENENLQNSAAHLAKWLFNDISVATDENRTTVQKPARQRDDKLDQERANWELERYNEARSVIHSSGESKLKREIELALDESIKGRTRKLITDAVYDEIGEALEADKGHMARMGSLWTRAAAAKFSGDHKSRIVSAYLARAKSLVPTVRKKIVLEVLGRKTQSNPERLPPSGAPVRMGGKDIPKAKDIDWSKTSDLDFLRGNYTKKS